VNCPHCQTSHGPDTRDWPCSWDQERRLNFVKELALLGVLPHYIPSMAAEVQKLSIESAYEVTEQQLYQYLRESRETANQLADMENKRKDCLGWAWKISRPFHFTTAETKTSVCVKLMALVLVGLPLFALTFPIRMFFAILKWLTSRRLHPYFIGWLKTHGKKKVLL
jgi:hypothetical protein